jgi:type II secretory pathway pseudopilin PulG
MKLARTLESSAGFTYIFALVMVVILGIMSAQAAGVWKTVVQREKETELLFRGTQIRDALQRFYYGKTVKVPPAPALLPGKNLRELKDLLKDPGSGQTVRYLRPFALIDPMTGKDWALVKDASQKIIGVASSSAAEPIKQGNFPLELEPGDFEGKKKLSEWQFIFNRIPQPAAEGGVKGIPVVGPSGPSGTDSPH